MRSVQNARKVQCGFGRKKGDWIVTSPKAVAAVTWYHKQLKCVLVTSPVLRCKAIQWVSPKASKLVLPMVCFSWKTRGTHFPLSIEWTLPSAAHSVYVCVYASVVSGTTPPHHTSGSSEKNLLFFLLWSDAIFVFFHQSIFSSDRTEVIQREVYLPHVLNWPH